MEILAIIQTYVIFCLSVEFGDTGGYNKIRHLPLAEV